MTGERIPDELFDAAERALNNAMEELSTAGSDEATRAIARALLAERERCAKIAEEEMRVFRGEPEYFVAEDIAKAIRS